MIAAAQLMYSVNYTDIFGEISSFDEVKSLCFEENSPLFVIYGEGIKFR